MHGRCLEQPSAFAQRVMSQSGNKLPNRLEGNRKHVESKIDTAECCVIWHCYFLNLPLYDKCIYAQRQRPRQAQNESTIPTLASGGQPPLRQVALLLSSLRVKITTKHYKQEENMKKQISRQRGGRVGLYVIQW